MAATRDVRGKAYLVTGGASGLGEAVVRRLVSRGARAAVLDLNDERGRALEGELGGQAVRYFRTDVVSEGDVRAAVSGAAEAFGRIDGTVQCAGVALPRRVLSSRGAVHSLDAFRRVLDINLAGTFNVLRLATEAMARQEPDETGERGVHLTTASVAAFDGQIGQAAYAASKGGVVAMTLPLARDLAKHGIRVVCVAPGIFNTPMMAKLPEKAKQSLSRQVPFPSRLGHPDEFASFAVTVLENQYLNGSVVRLDGSIRMSSL